ncbi:jg25145 [Pararge aegeria aegeria]|uniref:Jg25145 protein n=1 Tax=Pararge aegeria aegeria TaxID=348720 RepID=A0A8S4RWI3_9NEOP|nr:jg25145 [Pararge aegeria aegeria]
MEKGWKFLIFTLVVILSMLITAESTVPQPRAPNFQYFERPKYRYPYYDENGKGKLLYGYGDAGKNSRDEYNKKYGFRGEKLIEEFGNGRGPTKDKDYGEVKFSYTYSGANKDEDSYAR